MNWCCQTHRCRLRVKSNNLWRTDAVVIVAAVGVVDLERDRLCFDCSLLTSNLICDRR